MRAIIVAAVRRALALATEAGPQLRHLEVRDLIELAVIVAGLVLLILWSAR